jgi:CheY-like chemotaxis protein
MQDTVRSILVVEDEETTRDEICDLLVETGFSVETAATGREALTIMEGRQFDLLVADIRLPGDISGIEVTRRARHRQPALKCLFISGQGDPVVCDPELDDFVAKPFRLYELLGCVWKVLHGNLPRPRVDIAP